MPKPALYNISLKCFLHNSKWEVLILKTPEHSSFYGMYDFPGGRIDEEEFDIDILEILKREIYEEVGIQNTVIKPNIVAFSRHKAEAKFTSNWKDEYIYYNFFEAYIDSDEEIIISHEHKDFLWVKLEEIILEDYFCSGYLDAVKMYIKQKNYLT